MIIHCNAGKAVTSQAGELAGYGTVWYHPSGIANILSLAHVREKGFKVQYDDKNNQFSITNLDGKTRTFQQSPRGLYYMDTATETKSETTLTALSEYDNSFVSNGMVLVNTVEENKSNFSHRDYLRAVQA
jgi:hypothetical protein